MQKVLAEDTRVEALQFIHFWLEMIHLFAQDDDDTRAPVILVGTHKDQVPRVEQHMQIDDIILRRFQRTPEPQRLHRRE